MLLIAAFFFSASQLGLTDVRRLSRGVENLGGLFWEMFPPDFSAFGEALSALVETVQIAFVGTVIGFVLSLPVSALALRNIFPVSVTSVVRAVLGFVRTVPVLFWAVVFVIAVGLGPLAGVLAVSIYSFGYLSKLFYEAFEGVDAEVLDALKVTGASKLVLVRQAVLPESMNTVVSQLLFMFEYNIRSSAVMGFVGAGGVGFLMVSYIESLRYSALTTVLFLTLATVIAIDIASGYVRRRFLPGFRTAAA
ncbi:MAG: phosphonate ABC transporter, permease protein PhnE [Candidatus Caldarchaeum sp.]|nr:phosphonate ABC transporter, permease protein PhnE [Candidatus Caldarchaeum sp.]MDW8435844.1 phosphonate ABC transporter, permease protein PhnE [Candidatus Caldarchaeum sp.]